MSELDLDALGRAYAATASDGAPAYERIKQLVTERVRSGEWPEGTRLPSEHQFVAAFGLSRMTVNRAMRELTDASLIVRNAGVGTFVAAPKAASPLFEVRNIAEEVQARGHRHRTEVLSMSAGDDTAGTFGESHTKPVVHSVVVHYEDEHALQFEDRWVNADLAPDYLSQDFTTITPNTYLSRVAPLVRAEHIVEAVLPSTTQAKALGIAASEPCLQLRRRTWSADGLVSVAVLVQPGSRTRLEGAFEA